MNLPEELKDTLTFILAGGKGERLKPLTENRAKPAVPIGGAYRIIDFTLSNCIHSNLRRIYVLTQYRAYSLEEHLRMAWNFLPRRLAQYIAPRPPEYGGTGNWYRGTADAITRNLKLLRDEQPKHVLILSGDHIYKMNYSRMLEQHLETGAACTVGAVKIPAAEAPRFGILQTDARGSVVGFQEKPEVGSEVPGEPGTCLGSMGIYIFEAKALVTRLLADAEMGDETDHDFGKDILPRMVEDGEGVWAHAFESAGEEGGEDYWRDVGTLDAYFEANLDLCSVIPAFNLYDQSWPIYTLWHNDPPAKTVFGNDEGPHAEVVDSLLCNGSIVSGSSIRRSILSNRVYTSEGASVDECILMNGVNVGAGAQLKRVIADKWVQIPAGERIGFDLEADAKRFKVTKSGIVVVPKDFDF